MLLRVDNGYVHSFSTIIQKMANYRFDMGRANIIFHLDILFLQS